MRDAERAEKATSEKAKEARDAADRRRLEVGQLLCEKRKNWPARGPKAKGWSEFLLKCGILPQSALEWMRLAGYVEISKPDESGLEIPSRRQVEAARKAEREEVDDRAARAVGARLAVSEQPTQILATSMELDIDKELSRMGDKIVSWAKVHPAKVRRQLANEMREWAQIIEEIQ